MNILTRLFNADTLASSGVYTMIDHICVMNFGDSRKPDNEDEKRCVNFLGRLAKIDYEKYYNLAMIGYRKGWLEVRWFYNAPKSFMGFTYTDSYDDDWWTVQPEILKGESWQVYHAAYMRTDRWFHISDIARLTYQNRCALCYSDESINVHHRNYERLGREFPEDLIVLCRNCHYKFHNK